MRPDHPAEKSRLLLLLFFFAFIITGKTYAQEDGKALFQSNCAQCHNPIKVVTGPALKGVTDRVPDQKLLHEWIHNNPKVLASGNVYFNNLFNQYGRTPMNVFPNLSDADIDAILKYVDTYAEPMAKTNTSTNAPAPQEDHTVLFGIVTFILALFVGGLYLVNSNLKRLADEKRGLPPPPHIPFYRNKYVITLSSLVLFVLLGWWVVEAAIGLGRQQGYQPVQPIFFSHRVHAGLNQISCLYCHGNAWESKHATVPSPNICMNCHAAINDYHGEKLTREDGSRVDPNQEIQKLYSYTGYDPKTGRYTRPGQPDRMGKDPQPSRSRLFQSCAACPGRKSAMSDLPRPDSGNGRGQTVRRSQHGMVHQLPPYHQGRFPRQHPGIHGNKFYTHVQNVLSNDLKTGKMDSVTVENIGGTECQKCHY